jgi:hypothetical protein
MYRFSAASAMFVFGNSAALAFRPKSRIQAAMPSASRSNSQSHRESRQHVVAVATLVPSQLTDSFASRARA